MADMTRSVMRPLLALVLTLGLFGAEAADARPADVTIVVSAEPGKRADARQLVERAGGRIGGRLDVIHGFTARVPRSAIARLRRADAIRSVVRDVPLHLSDALAPDVSAAAPIEPPPAEIPTDEPADDVAREVLQDATEDTTVGSLAPDPIAAGEDVEPVAAGEDAVLDPTAPVEPQPDDGPARARASMDAIRAGIGATGSGLTGAGPDGLQHQVLVEERGQHQHADLGVLAGQLLAQLEALAVGGRGELEVEQHDLRVRAADDGERLAGAGRLGDDPQVVLALQDRAQALPDDRVVVDEHDAHDVAAGTSLGRGERGHVRPPTGRCRGARRRGRRRAR